METSELPTLDALQILFGVVAIPVIALGALLSRRFVVLMLGVLLFLSSIGVARDWMGLILGSWILPLQQARNVVFVGLSGLILVGGLMLISATSLSRVSLISWLLLAIGAYQGFARIPHEGVQAGLVSIAFAFATIMPIALILPTLVRSFSEWKVYSQIVAIGMSLFVAACTVQALLDPSRLTTGLEDRFIGVAANPQHVAVFAAGVMTFAAWRIWGEPVRKGLPFWIALFAGCGVLILLTGSRTGVVMATIGTAALGYRRLGRAVLAAPALALLAFMSLQVASFLGVDLPLARLSEGGDTRSIAWSSLLAEFMSSPMIGVGMSELDKSENSFLYAGASFGIGMVLLVITLAIALFVQCIAVMRAAQPYRRLRPIADLVLGFNLAYFFGANFEGYIMSRNSAMMVLLMVSATVGCTLIAVVREVEASADPELALRWGMDELYAEFGGEDDGLDGESDDDADDDADRMPDELGDVDARDGYAVV